jgi:hypothetical protein
MWSQIDSYYRAKLSDDQEHEAMLKANPAKVKEFSREFNEIERKAGLTNSLQDLTPGQINRITDLDYMFYDDIINCTFQHSFIDNEVMDNWHNITSQLAFPPRSMYMPWLKQAPMYFFS